MSDTLIYFDEFGYAQTVINPTEQDLARPGALVNPDLSQVGDLLEEPYFWKCVAGQIVPMTILEQATRHAEMEAKLS